MKNKYGMEMLCGERERPDGQLMMPYHLEGASGKGCHHFCGNKAVYRVGTAKNYEEEYEIPDLNSPRSKWIKEKHKRIQGTILACGKHLEIAEKYWKQHERQPNSFEQPEVERLDGEPMRRINPPYKKSKNLMESKYEIDLKKLDGKLRDLGKRMDLDYQNLRTIQDLCQDEFDALTKELREKIFKLATESLERAKKTKDKFWELAHEINEWERFLPR